MPASRNSDPISSFDAEKIAEKSAKQHRDIIRAYLKANPNCTAWEIAEGLRGQLTKEQIQKRLSECAVKGERRACTTGIPSTKVYDWKAE